MNLITRYRKKRAIRLARKGLALLSDALKDAHLPRAVRRRICRNLGSGTVDPSIWLEESR